MSFFRKRTLGQWVERIGDAMFQWGAAITFLVAMHVQPSIGVGIAMLIAGFLLSVIRMIVHDAFSTKANR